VIELMASDMIESARRGVDVIRRRLVKS
jgi:hypothetical protein